VTTTAPDADEAARIDRVLAYYPVRAPWSTERLSTGGENETFRVADASGVPFVLRGHRRNRQPERVAFQLRFQEHLRRAGIPTAAVIASDSGAQYVIESQLPWALFTYVPGAELDYGRAAHVEEAGRWLARFHLFAETFVEPPVLAGADPPLQEWWDRWEENLSGLRALLTAAEAEPELAYLRDWWQRFRVAWPDAAAGSVAGWLHGDYHGRNIVYAGDRLCGLFDFDSVSRGPLAFDAAHGVFFFGRAARGTLRVREDAAKRFLAAYEHVRPMTDDERAALPWMVVLDWTPQPGSYTRLRQEGADLLGTLRHDVTRLQAMEAEPRRVGTVWSR